MYTPRRFRSMLFPKCFIYYRHKYICFQINRTTDITYTTHYIHRKRLLLNSLNIYHIEK